MKKNNGTFQVGDYVIAVNSNNGLEKDRKYEVKVIDTCRGCGRQKAGVEVDGKILSYHEYNFKLAELSLKEQLELAVECEDYRLAAKLHKQIKEMA